MALRAPDVEVRAITIVAGNVPVAQAARNALYTAELCGSDVPVYRGAETPLLREYMHAEWVHGKAGPGDHNYPAVRRRAVRLPGGGVSRRGKGAGARRQARRMVPRQRRPGRPQLSGPPPRTRA